MEDTLKMSNECIYVEKYTKRNTLRELQIRNDIKYHTKRNVQMQILRLTHAKK